MTVRCIILLTGGIQVGGVGLTIPVQGERQREVNMAPQERPPKVVKATSKAKPALVPVNEKAQHMDWAAFLRGISGGKTVLEYGANRTIFVQGDPADSVFYLHHGEVKLAVTSKQGKEAIVAILGDNEFFGEGCLAGQPLRISAAIALSDCTLSRIEKPLMVRLLHEQHEISELFMTYLLTRNTRFEEDLVDQLFNSSEKRLARVLLLLAHFGKESRAETVHPGINQEHLAQMVGHHPVAGQSFHEEVPDDGFCRLHGQRRVDGQ